MMRTVEYHDPGLGGAKESQLEFVVRYMKNV